MATVEANFPHDLVFDFNMYYTSGGYFALDDVKLSDGMCPPIINCDFERDFCGWSNEVIVRTTFKRLIICNIKFYGDRIREISQLNLFLRID